MLIYTGVRVSELLDLKKENINLKERWFDVTESKTQAGIRKVPISKKSLAVLLNIGTTRMIANTY
ncbi:MAG: tyrosine-type recombinase/integrase [Agathobacter rectalis]